MMKTKEASTSAPAYPEASIIPKRLTGGRKDFFYVFRQSHSTHGRLGSVLPHCLSPIPFVSSATSIRR